MYRLIICIFALCLCLLPTPCQAQKVHAVIFADTNDPKIGAAMKRDVEILNGMVTDIRNALSSSGIKTDLKVYTGGDCSPKKVLSYIDNLSCQGDIVLFLYTGHGARSHSDSSKFPRMCLGSHYSNEWVKVSDVVDKLKAKKPRLQMVLAECCNSYFDRKSADEAMSAYNAMGSGDGLRELFLNHTGDVCITAASPGEYGWCNQYGSYLLVKLKEAFCKADTEDRGTATWSKLFQTASDMTYNETRRLYERHVISKSQKPVFDVNVRKAGGTVSNANNNNGSGGSSVGGGSRNGGGTSVGSGRGGSVGSGSRSRGNARGISARASDSKRGLGVALIHAIPFLLIGFLLFFKMPSAFGIEGTAARILRVVGVILFLWGLKSFFSML